MLQAKVHTEDTSAAEASMTTPVFEPSDSVKEMFQLLQMDGLKNIASAKAAKKNMEIFNDSAIKRQLFPKDIGLYVDVKLAREHDLKLPHRVKLAGQVAQTLRDDLQAIFRGVTSNPKTDSLDADAVLCVRVVLVSDGSSLGRRFTSKNGVGTAKLTVAYCLENTRTGEVAMADQLYANEDCSELQNDVVDTFWEHSSAVVRGMARNLAGDICEEITSAIVDWKLHKKEQENLMARIQVKLAEEENLSAEEYAFAAEKHLL